ncbi:DUF378 domain-containing protein [Lysobacter claricitrinus]|uniref:DUF378 domain-containing protein n=1 Tax=Lysobacter claricitrinus TaxID=3367728 RepID=UPI0037DB620A
MKALNLFTLVLVVIGGINWGLVGLLQVDLVAAIFGGAASPLARMVDLIIGASALWQLMLLMRLLRVDTPTAQPG